MSSIPTRRLELAYLLFVAVSTGVYLMDTKFWIIRLHHAVDFWISFAG